ncbi:hypothetical protein KM043_007572 [Ampulex compressa]|nr:hypothetical protein KM043_007572 [Ampulex compressa]
MEQQRCDVIDKLSVAIKYMQKCLECTICLHTISSPVKTRCGHSFCHACIGKVLNKKKAQCPLCNTVLTRRSISKDEHMEMCIARLEKLIGAIRADSGIDILSHTVRPHDTKEGCSSDTTYYSQSEQPTGRAQNEKAKATLPKPTTQHRSSDEPRRASKFDSTSRKTSQNPTKPTESTFDRDQTSKETLEYYMSGVEPLVSQDLEAKRSSAEGKVQCWLKGLPDDVEAQPPGTSGALMDCSLDDTVIESFSRPQSEDTDSEPDGVKWRLRGDNEVRTSNRSLPRESEGGSGAKNARASSLEGRNRASREAKLAEEQSATQLKFNAVHARVRAKDATYRTRESQNSLESSRKGEDVEGENVDQGSETTMKKWNSIVQFGKEMKGRRKKLRSLNVSIEGKNGSRMSGEALRRRRSAERRRGGTKAGESRKEREESAANTLGSENRRSCEREHRGIERTSTEAMRNREITRSSGNFLPARVAAAPSNASFGSLDKNDQAQTRSLKDDQAKDSANITRKREAMKSCRKDLPMKITASSMSEKSQAQVEDLKNDETNENASRVTRNRETTNSLSNVSLIERSQPAADSFITFEEGAQVHIRNLNSAQMNDIIGISSANESSQGSQKKLSLKRYSNSPRGSSRNIEPSPPLVLFEDYCPSPAKSQSSHVARSSTPLQGKLSLKKNQTSCSQGYRNSTSLESAKRDLTEEMNKDRSTMVKEFKEPSRNRKNESQKDDRSSKTANLIEHRDKVLEERGRAGCSVIFKKLGRVSRIRGNVCKFLYLGTTRGGSSIREERRTIEACRRMEISKEIDQAVPRAKSDNPLIERTRGSMDPSDISSRNTITEIAPAHRNEETSMIDRSIDVDGHNAVTKFSEFVSPRKRPPMTRIYLHENTNFQRSGLSLNDPGPKPQTSNNDFQIITRDQEALQKPEDHKTNQSEPKNTEELSESLDKRATTSRNQSIPGSIKLLSPEKDSQLKFLSLESPLSESLKASRLDNSLKDSSFSELKGVHSRALLESQSSKTKGDPPGTPRRKRKRTTSAARERLSTRLDTKSKQTDKDSGEESNDSTTSFFSKATMIWKRAPGEFDAQEETRRNASTSNLEEAGPIPLTQQPTQGIQVIFLSEETNEEDNKEEEQHSRSYKRIRRKSSSNSETETIFDGKEKGSRVVENGGSKREESSKRKRGSCNEDDDDAGLKAILSSWRTDMSGSQTFSKRGKLEQSRLSSNLRRNASDCQGQETISKSKPLLGSQNRSFIALKDSSPIEVDMFDAENMFEAGQERNAGCSRRKKPAEENYFHDIIDRVKEIQKAQEDDRSSSKTSRVEEEEASRRSRDENAMQDNFDEVIANVDTQVFVEPLRYSMETPLEKSQSTDDRRIEYQREFNRASKEEANSREMKASGLKDDTSKTCKSFRVEKVGGGSTICPSNISRISDKENEAAYRRISEFQEDVDVESSDKSLTPEGLESASERRPSRKSGLRCNYENPRSFAGQEAERRSFEACKETIVEDSGPRDTYSEQDSLMNVTQQQLLLKQFEEDLFGRNRDFASEETSRRQANEYTPVKFKGREGRIERSKRDKGEEHSCEEDDIVESTPDTKVKNSGPQSRSIRQNPASSYAAISSTIGEAASTTTPSSRPARSSTSTPISLCNQPLHQSTPKVPPAPSASRNTIGKRVQQVKEEPVGEARLAADPEKLCFACSGLSRGEVERVKDLARNLRADFSYKFSRAVSHVIVRAEEDNTATKTLKYLQGIAHRRWVLSYAWVLACFKEQKLVREEPYEAVDPVTLEAGAKKARRGERPPFLGFAFLCVGPYKDVMVGDYVDLLLATGAVVVKSIEALQAQRDKIKIIAVQPSIHDKHIIGWHQKTRAIIVADEWIIECISQYRVVSMRTFLQELVPQDVIALGHPELVETDGDLVDENEVRMSSDEENDVTIVQGYKRTNDMY